MTRLSAIIFSLILFSNISFGQSAADLEMAKSIARQQGYSEKEINAILNHQIGSSSKGSISTSQATQRTTSVATGGVTETGTTEKVDVVVDNIIDNTVVADEVSGIYGHDIFKTTNLNFVPSYNLPTPDDYILAPGDEVIIDVWGAAFSNITSTISPEGSIMVEGVGPIYLTGQTIKQAEKSLKVSLSRVFSGLQGSNPDTYMKLSLGKIRSFSVNILGDVSKPGTYTIPSLSTIASAMYLAGGVTDLGSVREIKLYRKNKLIKVFDVYDFIVDGDFSADVRLEDNDLLKVDPYISLVTIKGKVKRPMRYEMREKETISDLIKYCGGFSGEAFTDNVLVTRSKGVQRKSFDVPAKEYGAFVLEDGDIVEIASNLDDMLNRVMITGPVYYPGYYSISDTLSTLKRLFEVSGGLRKETYMTKGLILRKAENKEPFMVRFSPEKVLSGEESIDLMNEDEVRLYTIQQLKDSSTVEISGEVINPTSIWYREGMMLSDMILLANGPTKDTYMESATISRINENRDPITITFSLEDVLSGKSDIQMMEEDKITIFSKTAMRDNSTVTINGAVNNPTTFTYREGVTLSEAILNANGFTEGATLSKIEIARRNVNTNSLIPSDTVAKLFVINLIENPDKIGFELMPYDIIMVRKAPDYVAQQTITIEGEVVFPGEQVVEKNEVRISDIIRQAGGFKKEAYIKGCKVSRVLTEEEYERVQLALSIANKLNKGDSIQIDSISVNQRYFIGIDIEEALETPGSLSDLVLKTSDIVIVPKMNNTVKISGGVLYENIVVYNPNRPWKYYVSQAGGFTKNAQKNRAYVVHMNNTVSTRRDGMKVTPGSEIVIPLKKERERRTISASEIMAIASSTTSIATMALTITRMLQTN